MQYHEPNDEEDDDSTNDYLRDTISLMTAMEARISNSAEERKKPMTTTTNNDIPKRRPKTATEPRRSSNNSSPAAKAKEAKDLAAQQWQRRKNYDPLKSMAKSRANKASRDQLQYTDESSDVESAASFTRGLSNPRIAMIRSDGGRHSLRQNNKCDLPQQHQQQPQSLGPAQIRRPPFKTNVMPQNGGRSTSSLSSKEAEFQVMLEGS